MYVFVAVLVIYSLFLGRIFKLEHDFLNGWFMAYMMLFRLTFLNFISIAPNNTCLAEGHHNTPSIFKRLMSFKKKKKQKSLTFLHEQ